MALTLRVIRRLPDPPDTDTLPAAWMGKIRGMVRLWDADTGLRTPFVLVVGDDLTTERGLAVRAQHNSHVTRGQRLLINQIKGVSTREFDIDSYTDPTRQFHADLSLPAAVLADYVGAT